MHIHFIILLIILCLRLVCVVELDVVALLLETVCIKFPLIEAHVAILHEIDVVDEGGLEGDGSAAGEECGHCNQIIVFHY